MSTDLRLWLPHDAPRCGLQGLMGHLDEQGHLVAVLLTAGELTRPDLQATLAHTWRMAADCPALGWVLDDPQAGLVTAIRQAHPRNPDGYRAVEVSLDLARWCGLPSAQPRSELLGFLGHALQRQWPQSSDPWAPDRVRRCPVLGPWRQRVERALLAHGESVDMPVRWSLAELFGRAGPVW